MRVRCIGVVRELRSYKHRTQRRRASCFVVNKFKIQIVPLRQFRSSALICDSVDCSLREILVPECEKQSRNELNASSTRSSSWSDSSERKSRNSFCIVGAPRAMVANTPRLCKRPTYLKLHRVDARESNSYKSLATSPSTSPCSEIVRSKVVSTG